MCHTVKGQKLKPPKIPPDAPRGNFANFCTSENFPLYGNWLFPNVSRLCRDLKPENILLGEDMHIQITDFGTAKMFNKDDEGKHSTSCVTKPLFFTLCTLNWHTFTSKIFQSLFGKTLKSGVTSSNRLYINNVIPFWPLSDGKSPEICLPLC